MAEIGRKGGESRQQAARMEKQNAARNNAAKAEQADGGGNQN